MAALVDNELMQGLPGNVFEPNSVINRAQMAVLLSNLLNKELVNPYPDRYITGKISNIEPSAGLITLQSGISRIPTAECRYYLDGQKAGAADLKAGDEVKLVLDKSSQVVFVKAERTGKTSSESGAAQIYTGQVSNLLSVSGEYWLSITDFNGDSLTRSVTGGIKVDKAGGRQEVSSLSRGDYVEIRVVNNKITKISTLDTSAVKGTVTSKRSTALTVRKDTGATIKLNVPADIVVTRGEDNVVSYDALREGYLVNIEAYENEAIRINIISYGNLEGVIRELDTSGTYGITIRNDDGDTRDYIVASDVEVRKEGYKIGFDELRAGERVKLELNSEDRVDYINVLDSDSGLEGWIKELDTSGAYGITIYDDDGDVYDYVVDSEVEVWEDGSEIDFDELRTGERVILELNSQDRVVYINVLDSGSGGIEGVIRDLDTSGDYSITIRDDDDQTRQYAVNSNVEVRRDGSEIDFDELRTGERVMLEKNSRGRVDYIVVIKNTSSNVTGKIADLVTGNNPVIRIEKSNGRKAQYTITNSTACYSDGESIHIYDLVIGSEVEVREESGKAKSIDVTDDQNITLEGEVTDVNTSSNKIKIKQVSGNEFTYYLKSNASLKDRDGDSINFKDVCEGWEVKLKLQDGKVYSLTKE
ncbi:Opacity-associated protein A LysM-like domain protein [Pelotomaculum sp. FP]|nr:Opacity-associated protein A LysM-like domain protein [Pelotomaculum sp. FP]